MTIFGIDYDAHQLVSFGLDFIGTLLGGVDEALVAGAASVIVGDDVEDLTSLVEIVINNTARSSGIVATGRLFDWCCSLMLS